MEGSHTRDAAGAEMHEGGQERMRIGIAGSLAKRRMFGDEQRSLLGLEGIYLFH
jgi:hypothetical protein